jgi:thioesterase domain-containing protein
VTLNSQVGLPNAECPEPRSFFWLEGRIFAADLYPDLKVVYISLWPAFAIRPNLEFLAEHFANQIRAIQPAGPYYLGGACLSSLVAYEVARKLVASGHDVQLLVMVEPWRPGLDTARRRLVQRLLLTIFRPTTLAPVVAQRLDGLGRRIRRTHLDQPEPLTDEQRVRLEWAKMRTKASAKVFENYVIRPYQKRLTVIVGDRSKERFLVRGAWAPFVRGGVEIHLLPGGHDDLSNRNTHFIAKIRECIDQNTGASCRDERTGAQTQSGAATATMDTVPHGQPA